MRHRVYLWLFVLASAIALGTASWFLPASPKEIGTSTRQEQKPAPPRPIVFGSYAHPVDWPPKIVALEDMDFTCTQAGEEAARAGKTETVEIDGMEFCKTVVSEGAAGSVYYQYAYVFRKEGALTSITFSMRMPQCANYDSPQKETCVEQQERFNPETVVMYILDTMK